MIARAADLIVASPRTRAGAARSIDPAELIIQAGRPVLIVPKAAHHFHGRNVIVAWKDTRESRRAVADALPLLKLADDVVVQMICRPDEDEDALRSADDVVALLRRQGVLARSAINHGKDAEVAELLTASANLNNADLIVAGAYGHSRAQEWVFGGVTRDLLQDPPCFVLFSH